MTVLPTALRHARRNAPILLPAVIFALYLGWYVLAFPRYETEFDASSRICSYDWQATVWSPMAAIERRLRAHFSFVSVERFGITTREAERAIGGMRVWP
jgi:hypothetical protein